MRKPLIDAFELTGIAATAQAPESLVYKRSRASSLFVALKIMIMLLSLAVSGFFQGAFIAIMFMRNGRKLIFEYWRIMAFIVCSSVLFVIPVFFLFRLIEILSSVHGWSLSLTIAMLAYLIIFRARYSYKSECLNYIIKSTYCPLVFFRLFLVHQIINGKSGARVYLPCDLWQREIAVLSERQSGLRLLLQDENENYEVFIPYGKSGLDLAKCNLNIESRPLLNVYKNGEAVSIAMKFVRSSNPFIIISSNANS